MALSSLPITIGRAADSTIVLADDYVSNHHARLVPRGKEWLVEDTGSTNGTFLGDAKVTAPIVVPVGGRIRIGRNVLELQTMSAAREADEPAASVGGRSDVGLHRHNNQDSMYAGPHLIAVADGVGGAAGGEVASWRHHHRAGHARHRAGHRPAVGAAQRRPSKPTPRSATPSRAIPALAGMSTTLTAILATDDGLTLAHIGDSRAYLLRDGALTQLTHDHTLVQSLIDEGADHRRRGADPPAALLDHAGARRPRPARPRPDRPSIPQPGDRYLVCSDGLSSYVSEADIAAGLAGDDPQLAANRLTDLALQAGGPDNISCVVADPVDDALERPAADPRRRGRRTAAPRRSSRTPQPTPTAVSTDRRGTAGRRQAHAASAAGSPPSPPSW